MKNTSFGGLSNSGPQKTEILRETRGQPAPCDGHTVQAVGCRRMFTTPGLSRTSTGYKTKAWKQVQRLLIDARKTCCSYSNTSEGKEQTCPAVAVSVWRCTPWSLVAAPKMKMSIQYDLLTESI